MPSCEECHRAKKSCDRDEQLSGTSCSRCIRLGVSCVVRISRQGQGPRKKRKHDDGVKDAKQPKTLFCDPLEHQKATTVSSSSSTEDGNLLHAFLHAPSSASTSLSPVVSPRLHYGIRYLIHSWSSFALARRSFTLLERACRLAAKCQVPMDEVFCPSRSDVIQPLLYNQKNKHGCENASKEEPPLQWEDVPPTLRSLCRLDSLENRYIMVREANAGSSRFLASDMFQQDITSVWSMEQTWKANEKPVVQLFLQEPADFTKFTKAIHYQMSRYTNPNKVPECIRINGLNVLFTNQSSSITTTGTHVQPMDLVYAFEIVTLEQSFYVCEFVFPKHDNPPKDPSTQEPMKDLERAGESSGAVGTSTDTALLDEVSLDDPLRMFDNLLPLGEDLGDEGFEVFLALLED